MAESDDYQPRTPERLVEILRAQSQNPRSWPNEAADAIEGLRDALIGLVEAVVRDSNDPSKGISGYTSARLSDALSVLPGLPPSSDMSRLRTIAHSLARASDKPPAAELSEEATRRAQ